MNTSIFTGRLKQMLTLRNMSYAELSRRCGINKSAICRYLQGKNVPKLQTVNLMAETLGVSPSWLLGFSDELKTIDIPPVQKKEYNPIDYSKLNLTNKIKIKAYYQALLDTQEG